MKWTRIPGIKPASLALALMGALAITGCNPEEVAESAGAPAEDNFEGTIGAPAGEAEGTTGFSEQAGAKAGCTKQMAGSKDACKAIGEWKAIAAQRCANAGKTLIHYQPHGKCADGKVHGVVFGCCDAKPEKDVGDKKGGGKKAWVGMKDGKKPDCKDKKDTGKKELSFLDGEDYWAKAKECYAGCLKKGLPGEKCKAICFKKPDAKKDDGKEYWAKAKACYAGCLKKGVPGEKCKAICFKKPEGDKDSAKKPGAKKPGAEKPGFFGKKQAASFEKKDGYEKDGYDFEKK